jgi:hypothetical protein
MAIVRAVAVLTVVLLALPGCDPATAPTPAANSAPAATPLVPPPPPGSVPAPTPPPVNSAAAGTPTGTPSSQAPNVAPKLASASANIKDYFKLQSKQLSVQKEVHGVLSSIVDDASANRAAAPLKAKGAEWEKASIAATQMLVTKLSTEEQNLVMELLIEDPVMVELRNGSDAVLKEMVRLARSPQRPIVEANLRQIRDGVFAEVDWARGASSHAAQEQLGKRGTALLPETGNAASANATANNPKTELRGISAAVDAFLDAREASEPITEEFHEALDSVVDEPSAKRAAQQLPVIARRLVAQSDRANQLFAALTIEDRDTFQRRQLNNFGKGSSGSVKKKKPRPSYQQALAQAALGPHRDSLKDAIVETRDIFLGTVLTKKMRKEFVDLLGEAGEKLPE